MTEKSFELNDMYSPSLSTPAPSDAVIVMPKPVVEREPEVLELAPIKFDKRNGWEIRADKEKREARWALSRSEFAKRSRKMGKA